MTLRVELVLSDKPPNKFRMFLATPIDMLGMACAWLSVAIIGRANAEWVQNKVMFEVLRGMAEQDDQDTD